MTHAYMYAGLPAKEQYRVRLGISIHVPNDIIDVVCDELNVQRKDMLSSLRKRYLVEARQIAIGLILESNRGLALKKVGAMFNRDHSTIIYAREQFNDLYGSDKQFTKKVDLIRLKTNNLL